MISSSKIVVRLLACAGALGLGLPAAVIAAPKAPSPIAGVCQAVMGLEPGQAQFEGCMESLGGSTHDIGGARALVDARQACLDRGLKVGTAALAVCAVQGEGTPSVRSPMLVDASAAPAATRSWFSVSNSEQHRRERLACASLGLDPTSGAFDSCVAGLAATLFELDNPSN